MDIDPQFFHPEVEVVLSGQDGNAFAIISACKKAVRRSAGHEASEAWAKQCMKSESYDELLQFCMATLDIS